MKNSKKILKLCTVPLMLVCFLFIGISSATPTIINSYTAGAADTDTTNINAPQPSSGAISASSAIYQTFKTDKNGTYLTQIILYMNRLGSPNAIYRCALYNATGAYGTTSTPDTLIETSTTDLQASTLQLTNLPVAFTFAGTSQLIADTAYAIVFYEYSEVTCTTSACARPNYDSVGVASGNMGFYYGSTWNPSLSQDDDLCYELWGEGGTEVLYIGGNTYILTDENTYQVNAGDIISEGEINVDLGGVTADFNNTQVTASGDIQAGDVQAGDVQAGDVYATGEGGSTVPLPINYLNSAALILLAIVCIFLTIKPSVPILNFVFGLITFGIIAATAGQTDMLLYGYLPILNVIMAIICMISGYVSWKH